MRPTQNGHALPTSKRLGIHEPNAASAAVGVAATGVNGALLLTVQEVSHLLGISVRKIQRMKSLGRFPKEVRIGGSVRWRRHDVEQWIADGCPKLDNRQ